MADNNTSSIREMDSYRIHKDIDLLWHVKTQGQYISFVGRDIKLFLTDPKGGQIEMPFTIVDDCYIHMVYYGKDHKHLGTYMLTIYENYMKVGMTALDETKAFRLVPTTDLETRHSNE